MRHPNLIANDSDLAKAREWINKYNWYRQIFDLHKEEIDRFLSHGPIYVSPLKQIYQYKMYECPNHNVSLIYDEFSPFEHRCPIDKSEVYTGGKYDSAWAGWYNSRLGNYLYWMGLLYHIYNNEKYAIAGKELLMKFADLYLKYPTDNTILGPAHVFFGTLSESFWGVSMAYGYDLLYNYPGFSENDRQIIKDNLFYPLAKITQLFPESASNRQLWYNNVSAAVGFLYDDKELLNFAFRGKYGFEWQLGSALPESGFWGEGPGYHFVTLHGMITLAEMAKHNGIDLYKMEISGRTIKKMFDSPFELIKPNYEFPRFKDSGGGNILEYAPYYEVGYAVYKDPKYLKLLNISTLNRGSQIVGIDSGLGEKKEPVSLFNIVPELTKEKSDIYPEESTHLTGNGIALLRSGKHEKRACAILDYGILGGEHGHPDRLQIEYYATGKNWIVDPLNESYFNPNLQTWYRQTIAHNTIVIDETTQAWANGKYHYYNSLRSFQVASGFSEDIYIGACIARTLIQAGDYFIDLVDVKCADERIIDLPLHSFGKLEIQNIKLSARGDIFGPKPGIPGYDQLTEIYSGKTDEKWSGLFDTGDGKFLLYHALAERDTEVFKAMTPPIGGFYKQMVTDQVPLPMLFSRRINNETIFVSLIHAFDGKSEIKDFNNAVSKSIYVVDKNDGQDVIFADLEKSIYWLIKKQKTIPKTISGFNVAEMNYDGVLWFSSISKIEKLECVFSEKIINISISDFVSIKIYTPCIEHVQLNGKDFPFERDGNYIYIKNINTIILEYLSPENNNLFIGQNNKISFKVWNLTDKLISEGVKISGEENWGRKAKDRVNWWGGVVNLLALNKNSIGEQIYPEKFRYDYPLTTRVESVLKPIRPFSPEIIDLNLFLPNDIPPVESELKFKCGEREISCKFNIMQPVSLKMSIPNNKKETLSVTVKNNTCEYQKTSLRLESGQYLVLGRTEFLNVDLLPKEEISLSVMFHLQGYNPDNQLYEVIATLFCGEYEIRIKRDFYIGTAYYTKKTPSLNSFNENWNKENPMTIDKRSQICKLLMGNQPWKGPEDLSAKIYVMYDEEFIYIGAEVIDSVVITHFDFPKMSYPWDTDSMEIVLDTRINSAQGNDPPTPGLFRHLCLAESEIFDSAKWQGGSAGGPILPKPNLIPDAETHFSITEKGYNMICRIPLSNLRNIIIKPGYKIGFDIAINDNDGTTYRKNQHIWAGYTQNQSWWDMSTIGALLFGEKD